MVRHLPHDADDPCDSPPGVPLVPRPATVAQGVDGHSCLRRRGHAGTCGWHASERKLSEPRDGAHRRPFEGPDSCAGRCPRRAGLSRDSDAPLESSRRLAGKVNALNQGCAQATGEWLLFSDADVEFAPGTLRQSIALCEAQGLDHLVASPHFRQSELLLDATTDVFLNGLLTSLDFVAITNPKSKAAVGGGVFSLVRRTALEKSPGFEWLRLEVADDLALGQMLKHSGAKQLFVEATEFIALTWYRTLGEMTRGLEKNLCAVLGHYRMWRLLIAVSVMQLYTVVPFVGLAVGPSWLRGLCALTLVVGTAARLAVSRWAKRGWFSVLLFPVGSLCFAWMALRSGILLWRQGGIIWRARTTRRSS